MSAKHLTEVIPAMNRFRLYLVLPLIFNLLFPASIYSAPQNLNHNKQVLTALQNWTNSPRQELSITSQFAETGMEPELMLSAFPASPWLLWLRWSSYDRSFYYSSSYEQENHRGSYRGGYWSGTPAPNLSPGPLSHWPLLPWPNTESEIHFLGTKKYYSQQVNAFDFQPSKTFLSPYWPINTKIVSSRYLLFITDSHSPQLVAGEYYWRLNIDGQLMSIAMHVAFHY